jgi:hypothetical protein
MARKKPLVLTVSPDVENDPQVKLNDRQPNAGGRVKIEWRRDKGAADFDFIGFLPSGEADGQPVRNPFKNISVKKTRIKCDFEPERDGVEYSYTLAIEQDDVVYNTDEVGDPDFGRAVIRN